MTSTTHPDGESQRVTLTLTADDVAIFDEVAAARGDRRATTAAALIREAATAQLQSIRDAADPTTQAEAALEAGVEASVRSYSCPECGAEVGESCRTNSGRVAGREHFYRRLIATSCWLLAHPTTEVHNRDIRLASAVEALTKFGWSAADIESARERGDV